MFSIPLVHTSGYWKTGVAPSDAPWRCRDRRHSSRQFRPTWIAVRLSLRQSVSKQEWLACSDSVKSSQHSTQGSCVPRLSGSAYACQYFEDFYCTVLRRCTVWISLHQFWSFVTAWQTRVQQQFWRVLLAEDS